jgi:hypothetical protein
MSPRWMVGTALAVAIAGCVEISDNADTVLSLEFDSLPSPSVVVGDSMRDTTGAIAPPIVRAFNYRGEEITSPSVRFHAPDPGITIDSVTGVIRGDSLRSTSVRVVASVGSLQALQRLDVTLRPDAVAAVDGRDTLQYSLLDSTVNISEALTVRLTHGTAPDDSTVRSYVISFAIVSGGDPRGAELVNGGKISTVDTTDANGVAGRAVKIRPIYFTDVDSVIVNATVKFRGTPITGSPVRLVVVLTPPG